MPVFDGLNVTEIDGTDPRPPESCEPATISPPTAEDRMRNAELDYAYCRGTNDGIRHKRPIYEIAESWIRMQAAAAAAFEDATKLSDGHFDCLHDIRDRLIAFGIPKATMDKTKFEKYADILTTVIDEALTRAAVAESVLEDWKLAIEENAKYLALRKAALALADAIPGPNFLNADASAKVMALRKACELTVKKDAAKK